MKKSKQSRLESLLEAVLNVGSGMILAFVLMQIVLAPLIGIEISISQNVTLTSILTAVSVLRGYVWRRFFANNMHIYVKKFVQNLYTQERTNDI